MQRFRKALKQKRKQVHKDLRNAKKRSTRLKSKARQLSNDDLLHVLQLRAMSESSATMGETT